MASLHNIGLLVTGLFAVLALPGWAQSDSVLVTNANQIPFRYGIFSPDDRDIAVLGTRDVGVLDVSFGNVKELQGLTDGRSIEYSPLGRFIVSAFYRPAGAGGGAYLYDTEENKGVILSNFDRTYCSDASFSPDGSRIIVAHGFWGIIWDIATRKPLDSLNSPTASRDNGFDIILSRYSPDGQLIATTARDTAARFWSATSRDLVRRFLIRQVQPVSIRFSPDSRHILIAGDSVADVWDVSTGALLLEVRHDRAVTQANYSDDGKRIITSSLDGSARIWDAANGRLLGTLLGHRSGVWSASFSHDGKRVVTTGQDTTVRIWTLSPTSSGADEEATPGRGGSLTSYPNPAGDHVQLGFNLSQAGVIRLAIVDVVGQEVRMLLAKELSAGQYTQDVELDGLASGFYLVVLYTTDGVRSTTLRIGR